MNAKTPRRDPHPRGARRGRAWTRRPGRLLGAVAIGAALLVGAGCAEEDLGDTTAEDGGELTLDSCETNIGEGVPAFYASYFRCVDIEMVSGTVVIRSRGLPPHKSYYYGEGHPNYEPFDTSRGAEYRANPNQIGEQSLELRIPANPTAKGLTIDAAAVDGTVGSSGDEYTMGPAGVAIDSVALFNPLAAPGDDIEDEQFTFDNHAGHPAGTTYHYHTTTSGPLEVLAHLGLTTATAPGAADVELYGVMCDGTLVLGCTELSGGAIQTDVALDAQNGHAHDIVDGDGTSYFSDRYHTHICPDQLADHRFTPEIQHYTTCNISGGDAGGPP